VRRLTSIEFSVDPCNIYRDGPRGVGYPADARSVGDSHPSCSPWPSKSIVGSSVCFSNNIKKVRNILRNYITRQMDKMGLAARTI